MLAGWTNLKETHVQGHGKAKKMDSGVFLPQPPSWHCFFPQASTGYSILGWYVRVFSGGSLRISLALVLGVRLDSLASV